MQSTTTVICRAFVMIFCLVTIPLAAIFGTSLPNIVKTLGWGKTEVSARDQGGNAPPFVSNVPDAAGTPGYPLNVEGRGQRVEGRGQMSEGRGQVGLPAGNYAVQAGFNEPASLSDGSTGTLPAAATPKPPQERPVVPVDALRCVERFERIQQRLQALGATYFRLESFGSNGKFYRFQCEMPIGGDGVVRHFEDTSLNSLEAMESVLAEIDSWMRNK